MNSIATIAGGIIVTDASSAQRLGDLAPLIGQFAPYLRLHPDEAYVTGRFDQFLAESGVHFGPPRTGTAPPDPLPGGDSSRDQYLYYDWNNQTLRTGNVGETLVYIHAMEHQIWGTDRPPAIALQFWFWYPFNGPATGQVTLSLKVSMKVKVKFKWPPWKTHLEDKTVLDKTFTETLGLDPFGAHEGDWEGCVLFLDENRELKQIRCYEHDYFTDFHPGDWEDVGGRPVLYSARNGHPTFARAGTYPTQKDGKPAGADESVDINIDVAKVKADVSVHLLNECGDGPQVDCAAQGQVMAVSKTAKDGPLQGFNGPPSPGWAGFQGSAGDIDPPEGDRDKQFVDNFTKGFVDAFLGPLDHVMPGILKDLAHDIGKKIIHGIASQVAPPILARITALVGIGDGGPRMPAGKKDWTPDWQAK